MTLRPSRSWAILFLAAALAVPAAGQSYRAFQDEYQALLETVRFRFGPLRIVPSFTLREAGYDDNVYFESDRGEPVRDLTATLSPEVRAYWPIRGRLILFVRDNPEYVYFLEQSAQRAFTNSLGGGFRALLPGRFVLSAEYGDDEHRRRLSSELQIPVNDRTRSIKAGLAFETARKSSLGLTGAVRKLSFEDVARSPGDIPLGRLLDREEREAAVEAYYQLVPGTFLFLRGGLQEFRFESPDASWRDASAAFAQAGLRFPILGRLRGILNVGYKSFDPKREGEPVFRGLVGDTGLDLRTGRFNLRLRYARDLSFSAYESLFYFVERTFAAGGSVYLTRFLRLDYDYGLGRSDFMERGSAASGDGSPSASRADERRQHTLALVVRLFRTTGLGVAFNAQRWTSVGSGFDRRRNFIGAVLTQSF
jgi:hypothetical protein